MFLFIGNCFFCGQILREIDKPFFLFMKKTINYYTKAYLEEKNILFWLIINLMGIFERWLFRICVSSFKSYCGSYKFNQKERKVHISLLSRSCPFWAPEPLQRGGSGFTCFEQQNLSTTGVEFKSRFSK